jgi:tetratricopeptide (TPR) repeat protein
MLLIGCIIGSARVPDNPFDHLFVAERHYKSNNLQQALDEIEKAIELEPYLGASYYLRGRVLMELGDDTSALEELAMAVRLGEIRMLGNQQTKRDAIAFLVSIDQRGNR